MADPVRVPHIFPDVPTAEVHVWLIALDAEDSAVSLCETLLSDDELARANRYRFPRDRRRFIMARGCLRVILGSYLAVPPQSVQFLYNTHGKPSLSDLHNTTIEFNLSHTDEIALLAVTNGVRVGIDIESGEALTDCRSLAERFFHSSEAAELATLPEDGYKQAFLNVWTRKEALMKAIGEGLAIGLEDVVVSVLPGAPARILSVPDDGAWTLYALDPGGGYVASLVTEGAEPMEIRPFKSLDPAIFAH